MLTGLEPLGAHFGMLGAQLSWERTPHPLVDARQRRLHVVGVVVIVIGGVRVARRRRRGHGRRVVRGGQQRRRRRHGGGDGV